MPMLQSSPPLSPEEQEQLQQTIEMFEVIVQASPNDSQSLEILKDAYWRVGRQPDALGAGRKLAEIQVQAGQLSSAVLEYEFILQHEPDNVEIIAALGEVEEKMRQSGQARKTASAATGSAIDLDFRAVVGETGTLMATAQTQRPVGSRGSGVSAPAEAVVAQALVEDGNEALARFLVQHRIAPEDAVRNSLERVAKKNKDLTANAMATSLLDEVVRRAGLDMEQTLCAIVDRSKFAYIPLEYYDIDRQIVKMLPEALTLGRLLVPFDVMSRTLMVATANPFDAPGKEAVQQLLDYNIQWHLASPAAIMKILGDTYKVAAPGIIGAGPDTSSFKLATS